jgi:lipopolysaccharide export system permease protein
VLIEFLPLCWEPVFMLPLLHRHILREISTATAMALALFVFVLLLSNAMGDIFGLVISGKLDVLLFFKLIALLIPYVTAYALPLGMLTGTLIALGRLSAQHEITAMKSVGVGLWQLASAVFLLSSLGVVLGLIVNLHYAPESRAAYKSLIASVVTENPMSFIEPRRFINEFPGAVIYAGEREGNRLGDIWFWKLNDAKQVELFMRGREGAVEYRKAENKLILTLRDGTTEQRKAAGEAGFTESGFNLLDFGELSFEWSLDAVFQKQAARPARVKDMTFAQQMERRKALMEQEVARGSGLSRERLEVQFHIQENCAYAFSVFSMAIFAVPLAIRVGRRESYANLGLALVIAMAFYAMMVAVSWMEGRVALRPDLLIWLPNIIFQSLGLYFLAQVNRH